MWALPTPGEPNLPRDPVSEPRTQGTAPGAEANQRIVENVLAGIMTPSGLTLRIRPIQSTRGGWERLLEADADGEAPRERGLDRVLGDGLAAFLQLAGRGRYVVVAAQLGFEVIEVDTLATVATLYHVGAVLVGVRPDGAEAVTVGRDRTARVWRLGSGEELNRVDLPGVATSVALSDDGRWLAAAFEGGRVDLYALSPPDLIRQSCRWLEPPCP